MAPLLDQREAHLEAAEITPRPQDFVADAGDDSDDHTRCVVSHEMFPYLATQRLKHHAELPPVPRGRIPRSLTPKGGPACFQPGAAGPRNVELTVDGNGTLVRHPRSF